MGFVVGTRPCGGFLEFVDEGGVCGRGAFLIYALRLRLPCNMNKIKKKKKKKNMGVPRLALGLSAPAPSYLTTCDPFPTVAFHHPPCVLPVPLGGTPLPWGIMPGAFCPPHPATRATSPRSVLSRRCLLPALECVPLEECLPSWGSAPSPLERMLPFT